MDPHLHRFTIYAGMSRAPRWAQELVGYDRPSDGDAQAEGPMLRLDAQQLRWAFGTPRYLQMGRSARPAWCARGRRIVIDAQLIEVVGDASAGGRVDEAADRTSQRILDAALKEAAAVGLQRITVEDVVRRAGVSRMTAYRRYPRRDDLVEVLVRRETQRFLGAVADAIESVEDSKRGLRRPSSPLCRSPASIRSCAGPRRASPPRSRFRRVAEDGLGVHRQLHSRRAPGAPSQQVRWVADVFARLFFTYISMPPSDPDFGDDAELRRFAHEVLTPMVERAVG